MDEFVIEWLRGQTVAAITAPAGSALKNKLIKLSNDYPGECDYIENKDGSVFGHVPVKYVKVSRPREYSEEVKKKFASHLPHRGQSNDQKTVLDD